MSRLPLLTRSQLEGQAGELFDRIVAGSRGAVLRADGGLDGPYNAWLYVPRIGEAVLNLGRILLSDSSLSPRAAELAILVVGARWRAEFEFWAHARRAREAGLSEDVIQAIRVGDDPHGLDVPERTVYEAAREIMSNGSLTESTVARLRHVLGDEGLIELITLCSFYSLVSFTLNAVDVPVPEGVVSIWGGDQAANEGFEDSDPEVRG